MHAACKRKPNERFPRAAQRGAHTHTQHTNMQFNYTLKTAYQYAILFYFASLFLFYTDKIQCWQFSSHSTFWALTRSERALPLVMCFFEEPFNSSDSSTLYTFPAVLLKKILQYIFINVGACQYGWLQKLRTNDKPDSANSPLSSFFEHLLHFVRSKDINL